jgi:hypothetical protein
MITLKDDSPSALKLCVTIALIVSCSRRDAAADVAFRAHIGEFLRGMLLVPVMKRRDVALFAL